MRAFLGNFVENLKSFDRTEVKARLRMLLAKIELNPADLSTLHYAIPAAPGFRWRPHGDSNPGYRRERAMS